MGRQVAAGMGGTSGVDRAGADRMAFRQEIARAVLAYGQWRLDLYRSIVHGVGPLPPAVARRDDACAFGTWLRDEVGPADRATPEFERVRELHASFHASAAEVLSLAERGATADATAALSPESEYGRVSSSFTLALMGWLAATAPAPEASASEARSPAG